MSFILDNREIFHFVFLFHISSNSEKMDWVFIYSFRNLSLEGI